MTDFSIDVIYICVCVMIMVIMMIYPSRLEDDYDDMLTYPARPKDIVMIPNKAGGYCNNDIDTQQGRRMIILMCLCLRLPVRVRLALCMAIIYIYLARPEDDYDCDSYDGDGYDDDIMILIIPTGSSPDIL